MTADFDFDPANSDLNIGIELEFPGSNRHDEYLVDRGRDTSDINNEIRGIPIPGHSTYDGTVGLELVSDVLDLEDAPQWYRDAIDFVEMEYPDTKHQPVGLMRGGSTAGLHLHLSSLSEDQARSLYEMSHEPWMQVLFCSSIAKGSDDLAWPVFRGGRHCRMEYDDNRYAVINSRSPGHWEWRLPEPMVPEHLEIVVEFLRAFEQSPDAATQYAQEVLDNGDERITSIQRAEAVGIDIEEMPLIEREQYADDPENFFEAVRESWGLPEVYRVTLGSDHFYTFESSLSDDLEYSANGVTFTPTTVLRADTLENVTDSPLAEQVRSAFQRGETDGIRETEATEELKKIIKKKKE